MHSYSKALIVIGVFYWSAFAIAAEQDFWGNWPQQISFDQGDVVVYQPQPEQLEGNRLKARAAVAVELKDVKEPVFGAVWFEARLDTDRDERSATIADVTVTNVRFSEQNKDKANGLKDLLEREMPKWDLVISMDRLLTTLEMEEKRMAAAEKIGTKPPHIIFVEEPAVLVSIDGEPRLQQQVNSKIMRVVNTPFTLLLNPNNKTYYLYAGKDTWYTAKDIRGEWRITSNVSNEIAASKPIREHTDAPELEREPLKSGETPKVIVATQPTELISSKGKPEFTPISGTDLLYMSNTESDIISKKAKILLSG